MLLLGRHLKIFRLLAVEIIASRANWSFPLAVSFLFSSRIKATLATLINGVKILIGHFWIVECTKSTLFVIQMTILLCLVLEVWLRVKRT